MASAPQIANDGIDVANIPSPDIAQDEQPQQDYGAANENIPELLRTNLITLARKFCEEDRYSRRLQIQTSRRAHFYWRDMQHLYWDYKSEGWQVLGPGGPGASTTARNADSAVMYTTNIYQAFGLSIMAVLTQNIPSVRYQPEDPQSGADIETAKAADKMRKIIEHNNDAVKLLTQNSFFAWVGSISGAWTRIEENKRTHQPQETISMCGDLELKVPITANEQCDFVYLQFSDEFHMAAIRHEVAQMGFEDGYAKKIKGGASGNGQDVYERTARISVKQGVSLLTQSGDTLSHLVTRQHTWMRPSAFEQLEDDTIKGQLNDLFPDGCHVRLDNGTYTGSWAENMDDCWAVMHPIPGDGMFRNSLGNSMVSVQERFNDIINITQDVYEKTQPIGWVDDEAVDDQAFAAMVSKPGARKAINRKNPAEPLAANFFFEPPASVSPDMLQYGSELMGPIGQFLTGAFPALFGGDTGANDTKGGIAMQRNQALGRIGIVWRAIKRFWARIMEQAVRLFAKNRQAAGQDVSLGIPDEQGNIETVEVRIEEMQGNVLCFPDSNENYPEDFQTRRAAYMSLLPLAAGNPTLAKILTEPENLELGRKLIGLDDFEIPGADSDNKQLMEIEELLKSTPVPGNPQPIVGPLGPVPDQTTGQPAMQEGPPQSSVPIDPIFDRHDIEFETGMNWINSTEGMKQKKANPDGFMNVRLHLLAHQQILQQQAMQMAAQAAAAAPKPAPPQEKKAA